jgi:hypothetical protein
MSPGAQKMKSGPDNLGTAENEFGRVNHENGTRHPRSRFHIVSLPNSFSTSVSVPPKTSLVAQNMKSGPDALSTIKNYSGRKTRKTVPDAIGTVENESGSANHANRI